MASLQVAGLASNFDWKAFVDSMMQIERQPINRMETEKLKNDQRASLLSTLGTKLSTLQTAVTDLKTEDLFGSRKVSSSTANSTWSLNAAADAAVGTYEISVTQLASKAKLKGDTNVGAGLNLTDSLANLATGTAIKAGEFTVNGVKITLTENDVATQTFQWLLTKIKDEAGLTSATYDAGTDAVTLEGPGGPLMLGASGDDSNVLQVLKLGNAGNALATSSGALGAVKKSAPLASANLGLPLIDGDGAGNGAFKINGVSINYNINTDSLSSVITRINESEAGVTATYDSAADRLVLENKQTGDLGISVSDTSGSFALSLGLIGPLADWERGSNAQFSINGGAPISSTSNTLTEADHGITGLTVTADSQTKQTVTIAADTGAMRTKIDAFISAYNDVQTFLEDQTKVSRSSTGKITVGPLSSNREIQAWGKTLRAMTFSAIGGLSGTVSRLEHLGIDFDSYKGVLQVKDSAKLTASLEKKSADVAEFFQTSTTGFSDTFAGYLKNVDKLNVKQQEQLTASNKSIDTQIEAIERRLTQQRAILESSFIAMETAQSRISQQQSMLTKTFSSSPSS